MNDQEAAKLLSLVKLSYPQSYRDMDRAGAAATVRMWASSFENVPYPVMERAFDRYRMGAKYPPTVAEMAGELGRLYFSAEEAAFAHRQLGNEGMVRQLRNLMACTESFAKEKLPLVQTRRELGDGQMGSAGALRDPVGPANGLPQLPAGEVR